jgi:hypothetical protein
MLVVSVYMHMACFSFGFDGVTFYGGHLDTRPLAPHKTNMHYYICVLHFDSHFCEKSKKRLVVDTTCSCRAPLTTILHYALVF